MSHGMLCAEFEFEFEFEVMFSLWEKLNGLLQVKIHENVRVLFTTTTEIKEEPTLCVRFEAKFANFNERLQTSKSVYKQRFVCKYNRESGCQISLQRMV